MTWQRGAFDGSDQLAFVASPGLSARDARDAYMRVETIIAAPVTFITYLDCSTCIVSGTVVEAAWRRFIRINWWSDGRYGRGDFDYPGTAKDGVWRGQISNATLDLSAGPCCNNLNGGLNDGYSNIPGYPGGALQYPTVTHWHYVDVADDGTFGIQIYNLNSPAYDPGFLLDERVDLDE